MRQMIASLALGAAALTGFTTAEAADFTRTAPGIRYGGGSAAVPAPTPVPDMRARWYFRADAALGFPSDPSFTTSGLAVAGGASHTTSAMYTQNNDVYAGYGLGVGYRVSPFLRFDMTVDTRSQKKYAVESFSYTAPIAGTASDSVTLRSVPVLFNGYLDFTGWGRFVPYIGGGIGFAVNELNHAYNISEASSAAGAGREKTHDVSLAAMGTAGFAYDIDSITTLDMNYRLLFVSESQVGSAAGAGVTRIGDQIDHQLRFGVRFNIH